MIFSKLVGIGERKFSQIKGVFITKAIAWAKPNPNNKCVTQLRIPITVTSIDTPLILVKDKSNTREDSRVTLRGLQGKKA
jgi:hypothetical protein